jgi:hypothetical protein
MRALCREAALAPVRELRLCARMGLGSVEELTTGTNTATTTIAATTTALTQASDSGVGDAGFSRYITTAISTY